MSDKPIKIVVIRTSDENQFLQLQEKLIGGTDERFDLESAANYLKVSRPTILKYIKTGKIFGKKVGKGWVIFKSELDRFLKW